MINLHLHQYYFHFYLLVQQVPRVVVPHYLMVKQVPEGVPHLLVVKQTDAQLCGRLFLVPLLFVGLLLVVEAVLQTLFLQTR